MGCDGCLNRLEVEDLAYGEYDRFMRDAGVRSKTRVANYLEGKNVDTPKERVVKRVKRIIADEREKARQRIIRARRQAKRGG